MTGVDGKTYYLAIVWYGMIKDPDMVKKAEENFLKEEGQIGYLHSLKIVESLYNEAVHLGVLPL